MYIPPPPKISITRLAFLQNVPNSKFGEIYFPGNKRIRADPSDNINKDRYRISIPAFF